MKRFLAFVSISVVSAISSVAVSSAMNGFAAPRTNKAPRTNNTPRCSSIQPGGQYWLEYKDNLGRTQSTQPAVIVGGAKVCISNPNKPE